jgi:outer membrane protein assembly factor BamB
MRWFSGLLLIGLVPAATTLAVGTSHWVHTGEKDWKTGEFENVVATNLGDLKLSRAVKTLLEHDTRVDSVYCMVEAADGTVYAGTGPQGVVLAINGDKVATAATLDKSETIFSIALDKEGRVLLGTGGDKGRVVRLDKAGAEPKEIFAKDGVQYVWGLAVTPDGNVYAATGPDGQLFEIHADGSHEVVFDSDENNLLSLVSDGKDLLFVGTDPNGRVYRVNRKTKESFVLYDAEETEISALALDGKGNLYAATGQADQAEEAEGEAGAEVMGGTGRPEGGAGGIEIPPTPPPANPEPPKLPEPNPGEPQPIPKAAVRAPLPKKGMAEVAPESPGDAGKPEDPKKPEKPEKPEKPPAGRPGPGAPSAHGALPGESASTPAVGKTVDGAGKGNAIYRIDADGFVTEVFREPVVVLSMIERNGTLLVGTGNEGKVYQIDPAAEETVALANVDPKQVVSLLPTKGGRILLGLANVGGVASMGSTLANDGTYTSPVLDATQVSRFGKMHLMGVLPKGTGLKVSTRSGNVELPEDKGWSNWSEPAPAAQYVPVQAPNARFLQYKLAFTSEQGNETPVVEQVDVAYQVPNLAPQVQSVKITPAAGGKQDSLPAEGPEAEHHNGATPTKPGRGVQTLTWDASDPNGDTILYSVYYRMGSAGKWILIKDRLKETTLDWDTRTVADGEYLIKVEASDKLSNPVGQGKVGSRVSDPVFVDNTAPVIGDLKWQRMAGGVKVSLRVVDRVSSVANLEFAVDSADDWQAVLPSDNIFDTPEESVAFDVTKLTPGQHQVTVRATDAHGNQGFESLLVTVDAAPEPTAQNK